MPYLDNQSLASIRCSSQTHLMIIRQYARILGYSIFRSFGFLPREFQHVLQWTKSVVSGPAALAALLPCQAPLTTMDIYVSRTHARDILDYLENQADYDKMLGPFYNTHDFQWRNLHCYVAFGSAALGKFVNVYIAYNSPMLYLLISKSTMAMNLITCKICFIIMRYAIETFIF